ncbi:FAD-dependent monooxygenase [Bradyrhizobium manausense]
MLRQRGIECELYDQANVQSGPDVGINLGPRAGRELVQLGLLGQLDNEALQTRESVYVDSMGREFRRNAPGAEARFEYPQFSVRRGRLLKLLSTAVQARLGSSCIHFGHQLRSFTQDERGVTVYFFDGHGSHCGTASGDILIGADGLHSSVRALLFPHNDGPRFTGRVVWCGMHHWPTFLTGRSMLIAAASASKLQLYPIAEGPLKGQYLTNWSVLADVGRAWEERQEAGPARPGVLDDVMPYVRRFSIPYCNASALIQATRELWEYPLYERVPLRQWSHGRVTLLGDAAHAAYPAISNGASRAILGARCLADKLASAEHPRHALFMYEQECLPKGRRVSTGSTADHTPVTNSLSWHSSQRSDTQKPSNVVRLVRPRSNASESRSSREPDSKA